MVFKFRLISNEQDDFIRDFEILDDQTFFDFHMAFLPTSFMAFSLVSTPSTLISIWLFFWVLRPLRYETIVPFIFSPLTEPLLNQFLCLVLLAPGHLHVDHAVVPDRRLLLCLLIHLVEPSLSFRVKSPIV